MYLLEYSDKQGCFHFNHQLENGEYEHHPGSNFYWPLDRLEDDIVLASNDWLEKFMADVSNRNATKRQDDYLTFEEVKELYEQTKPENMDRWKNEDLLSVFEMIDSGMSDKDIAYTFNRTSNAIRAVRGRRERGGYKWLTDSKSKPEIKNIEFEVEPDQPVLVENKKPASLDDFAPRDIIKHLYNLGYRIEDNGLVCYVKQKVLLKDILNN